MPFKGGFEQKNCVFFGARSPLKLQYLDANAALLEKKSGIVGQKRMI